MVPIAPRYSYRLLEAVRALDDRSQPIAEINRRVGLAALELGLFKPSYVHVRRLILRNRELEDEEPWRREEIRRLLDEAYGTLLAGRLPDVYRMADRIREAGG